MKQSSLSEGAMISEGLQEMQEEERDTAAALKQLESLFAQLRDAGGYPNWEQIVSSIDSQYWADPKFIEQVVDKFQHERGMSQLFGLLPLGIQADVGVQKAFFLMRDFDILRVPKSVLERCDKGLVLEYWFAPGRHAHFENFPWSLYDSKEKKKILIDQLSSKEIPPPGNVAMMNIYGSEMSLLVTSLTGKREAFEGVFTDAEWNELIRDVYDGNPDFFSYEVMGGEYKNVLQYFSTDEIRQKISRGNEYGKDRLMYRLSIPQLRAFEFGELDVEDYKAHFEATASNLTDGFSGYEEIESEDREWLLSTLKHRAILYHPDAQDFIASKLPDLLQRLPAKEVESTLSILKIFCDRVDGFSIRNFELSCDARVNILCKGILETQPAIAKLVMDQLLDRVDQFDQGENELMNIICPDEASAKIFRQLMVETGAKFNDFFAFYLDASFGREGGELKGSTLPLSERPYIIDFVRNKIPWVLSLLQTFSHRVEAGDSPEAVAQEMIAAVGEKIHTIEGGEWDNEFLTEEGIGFVTHVFPPAVGVSRHEYRGLIQTREGRQDDVPLEWESFQGKEARFALGKWDINEGEKFSDKPWELMADVVREVNQKKIVGDGDGEGNANQNVIDVGSAQVVEFGRKLLEILVKKDAALQDEALRFGYALHLARGGMKLIPAASEREEAVALFEWSKDGLRDIADAALTAYSTIDPDGFNKQIQDALKTDISPKAKKTAVRSIIGVMKSNMGQEEKTQRVKDIFQRFGVVCDTDTVFKMWEYTEDIENGAELVEKIADIVNAKLDAANAQRTHAGKLSSVISQKIMGADGPAMQRELEKWKFVEEAEGGEELVVKFRITKERVHSVVGLNMGVCVAVDQQLWNKEDFSNVVMFGEDGIARGGMHFEIVSDNGERYLSLPGINPNLTILREVNAEKVYDAMIDFSKQCAREIGARQFLFLLINISIQIVEKCKQ